MKKIKLITAGIIALTMVGCGSSSTPETPSNLVKTTVVVKKGETKNEAYKATLLQKKINEGTIETTQQASIDASTIYESTDEKNNKIIFYASMEADRGAIVENGKTGTINLIKLSDNSLGMVADGVSAEAINNGTINLIESNHKIGMLAQKGGHAINNGTINLEGSNDVGMWADGKNSEIINNGTITLKGTTTGIDSGKGTFTKAKELGKDNYGNIGMEATDGGKIINSGSIVFKNEKNI